MTKVQLETDSSGTIQGWTDEAFADKDKLVDVDTSTIALGVSKLVNGKVVTDQAALAEAFTAPQPTAEQQMINALGLQNAQLAAQVTALTEKLGGES